jgi:hypothetical protein
LPVIGRHAEHDRVGHGVGAAPNDVNPSRLAREAQQWFQEPAVPGRRVSFGRLLAELFGPAFSANPRLKFSVGRLLTAQLPPQPPPRGRPGYKQVTEAIRLREKLRPNEPDARRMWTQICIAVIPNYESFKKLEQKKARTRLRERLRWRLRARARRRRVTVVPRSRT